MAKSTLQPGTAPANPSRRQALGILATAPIAALPALAVMQCSEPAHAASMGDANWRTLVVTFEAARVHQQVAEKAQLAAERVYFSMKPKEPERPESPPLSLDLTLRQIKAMEMSEDPEYERAHAKWTADVQAIRERTLAGPERAHSKALQTVMDIGAQISAYPVRSTAQLREKMELLKDEFGDDWTHVESDWPDNLAEDIRRLAKMEA